MTSLAKRRVRIPAGEVAVAEAGDPQDPAVVFLHGFPTSSFLWRRFLPLFAPWAHAVAPDLLGCGDSDAPTDADLHIRAQAGYVRDLLGALGIERCAVVGHGHGGGVAQLVALEDGVDVEAAVLIDSIALDAWPTAATRELQQVSARAEREDTVREALGAFLDAAVRPERLDDEARREYLRPFLGGRGIEAFFRHVRAADGLGLAGRERELEAFDRPTLILWGEEDPFFPVAVAERLADLLPMATLALLPGCSHLLPEDAPETIAPLLFEYLRSRYLGRPHTHATGPVGVELGRRRPGEETE